MGTAEFMKIYMTLFSIYIAALILIEIFVFRKTGDKS